jgi:hypothetical protein
MIMAAWLGRVISGLARPRLVCRSLSENSADSGKS